MFTRRNAILSTTGLIAALALAACVVPPAGTDPNITNLTTIANAAPMPASHQGSVLSLGIARIGRSPEDISMDQIAASTSTPT